MRYFIYKRNSLFLIFLLTLLAGWSSCSDDDNTATIFPDPELSFEQDIWSLDKAEGEYVMKVKSNLPWRIKSNVNWITPAQLSGQGDGEIKIQVTENNRVDLRSGVIMAWITEEYSKELKVVQLGIGKQIVPSLESLSFLAKGGEQVVSVTANVDWEVSGAPEWLTIGRENDKLMIKAGANLQDQELKGTITLKEKDGDKVVEIPVTQAAVGNLISLAKREVKVGNAGGSVGIELITNVAYTCVPSADWIRVTERPAVVPGQINHLNLTIQIDPTADANPRVGYLYVNGPEQVADTLTISQGQITVTAAAFDPKATFVIESDKALSCEFAAGKPEWFGNISFITTEPGKQQVEIDLLYNPLSGKREGALTITDGTASWPMMVIQTPADSDTDRAALKAFFDQASGQNWVKPWKTDAPMETNATNWPGVTFENGRVTQIYMITANGIEGDITPLCNLLEIRKLQLKYQQLTGIPQEIGRLTKMTHFWMVESAASGMIPESIAKCSVLTEFNVSNHPTNTPNGFANSFTGSINPLVKIPTLVTIKVYCNNFNGSLPVLPLDNGQPTTWKGLKEFMVYSNSFSGSILAGYGISIAKHGTSGLFWVNDNQLSGTIPDDIKALPRYEKDKATRILKGNNLTE